MSIPFGTFLDNGINRGGFETDDALTAVLPLMRQTLAAHEQGKVAPLKGDTALFANPENQIGFDPTKALAPRKNFGRLEQLQLSVSHGLEVVGSAHRLTDVDEGSMKVTNLEVADNNTEITKPVFLPGYVTWEHAIGHHDELTDIFSLGLILASVACGLDFSDREDLEDFANRRGNLFYLNKRLNPVIAAVIVQMTELNRHRRQQDLPGIIRRLENYRDQVVESDFDVTRIKGLKESNLAGKRTLIQSHLRDRLFEISRRNRLIYFKPTTHTMNVTIASVPLVLDYRNIKLEQLFVWHSQLAAAVTDGAPMSLGNYLRFEESPYIPGVLDKIISEARRDRAEYGFGQLRLVICFLRWHNLKESPQESIHSPLILLPVELTKKKGIRDNYVLDPTSSEAEVNPALRHHLKELYNLNLPVSIDLKEKTLEQFYEELKTQIHASEPGVTLHKIDRPQIDLIHEKARQRVDQYKRRLKVQARPSRGRGSLDYSYERENFRPLGLQMFLKKVRPSPAPLRQVTGGGPAPRMPNIVATESDTVAEKVVETQADMYSLREREGSNPYSWDFDLCSITLGNFNYRKMTLVRDYSQLIETDIASDAFDTIFSLTARPPEDAPIPPLDLSEQHVIIACDATQASAVARARHGQSYIIQGPPGTGKSQTITNLIADYIARGKRVLFVCEKRAAIDVVFHRLRQQGLDELCCLIHDSQTDKKSFIQNLKQTYEKFLGAGGQIDDSEKKREEALRGIDQELTSLRRFSDAMGQSHSHIGLPLRVLLRRLVELEGKENTLSAEVEELLPEYHFWLLHGDFMDRLGSALNDLGQKPCFAEHPLRWLGKAVLESERPIETFNRTIEQAEDLVDAVESALELSGLPADLWDTIGEIEAILGFAVRVQTLGQKNLLGLLDTKSDATKEFSGLEAELAQCAATLARAKGKIEHWRDPLSPEDTQSALALAKSFEGSVFRFLQPAFWRLRKTLQARYDFSKHAVMPSWTRILHDLADLHAAQAQYEEARTTARQQWSVEDPESFQQFVAELRTSPDLAHPSIKAMIRLLLETATSLGLINSLVHLHARFGELNQTLRFLLAEHQRFDFPQLTNTLGAMRDQGDALPELLPVLSEFVNLPDRLCRALRYTPLPISELEAAMGRKSLNAVYRQDRVVHRFDSRTLAQKMARMQKHYTSLLEQNAGAIRARVRRNFLEHVNTSALPASQLTPEEKSFKKTYAAGRRDLEHEFGKTMRYKSIRDLAAGETGKVIQDLKPVWLMSPLSVSDTLPLEPDLFDVVIFDEASQIPVEEAIPALYRSNQVIVVGDEMQLPPTTFFASSRSEEESVTVEEEGEKIQVALDADSFLTQSGLNLPSTLLAWHYRSRYESLISFSNAAFYSGNLFTIPDRQRPIFDRGEIVVQSVEQGDENATALLERSISFHFQETGVYEERCNRNEAQYIARLVRSLLQKETKHSIGIVAFSEAQQGEIEEALKQLADEDAQFSARVEAEYVREEHDQFCGLFVKNLENVQGDERDIIILSICYGYDPNGRMLMNFGPINQRGGEKRLNVIFSRAKHHMAVVSSIRHHDITNDYNDGANSLKNFLHYAESISKGDHTSARRVLENLNPLTRKSLAPESQREAVVEQIAEKLRSHGYLVDLNVGQSRFRCDLAVRHDTDRDYRLGIMVDTDAHYAGENLLDRYLIKPSLLRAFGWQFEFVLTKDWYHDPEMVINRLAKVLQGAATDEIEVTAEMAVAQFTPADSTPPITAEPMQAAESNLAAPPPISTNPPRSHSGGGGRYFEFTEGSSRKFWEITIVDDSFSVRFGRIGTGGQSQTKNFPNPEVSKREANKLISEKVAKGYVEKIKE
jgi:superfamily I DNA and/or RNA helicase/predicted DNA-binding WGR domain protein